MSTSGLVEETSSQYTSTRENLHVGVPPPHCGGRGTPDLIPSGDVRWEDRRLSLYGKGHPADLYKTPYDLFLGLDVEETMNLDDLKVQNTLYKSRFFRAQRIILVPHRRTL